MAERNCSNCGKEVAAGRLFCGGCGQAVPLSGASAQPEQPVKFCVHCGAVYRPGKRFCQQCGHAIGASASTQSQDTSPVGLSAPSDEASVSDEKSGQAITATAIPAQPEPTALLCVYCGVPHIPGRRFCKQCGQAIGETAAAVINEPSTAQQGEPATGEMPVSDGNSGQAAPMTAAPSPPEPAVPTCVNCGAPYSTGKRFCRKCGQAVGTAAPTAANEPPPATEDKSPASKMPFSDVGTDQMHPVIAIPARPEPTALTCVNCGAACSHGKRFCRKCGQSVGIAAETATIEPSPVERSEPVAQPTIAPVLESANVAIPILEPAARNLAISSPIDSTQSESLRSLPLQAGTAIALDEEFSPNSQKTPDSSSNEEEFRPTFKFSGFEEEPAAMPQPQEDLQSRGPRTMSFGGYAPVNSDHADVSDLRESTARRRRILRLVIGGVCALVVLGAALFIATSEKWRHPSARIVPQSAPSTPSVPPAADQPSKPAPPTAIEAPIVPAKPALQKQEADRHETIVHNTQSKPSAANSHPTAQKLQQGNCALDANMLSKMLDQADRNREQGNYPDAARQYRSVLECDHNNTRAHGGLDLTLLAIQHQ